MNNLVAGLSPVSTSWTRPRSRRLSGDLSSRSRVPRQSVYDADLNSLILNGNGTLRRIEESEASEYSSPTPAPPYQRRESLIPYDESVYDYDGESCISPLSSRAPSQRTAGARGNRLSRYSAYSYRPGDDGNGAQLAPPPPAVISRDEPSLPDLGELTLDIRPHTPIFPLEGDSVAKLVEKKKDMGDSRSLSESESELEDEDIKSRVFSHFTDSSDTIVDLRFSLNSTDGNKLERKVSQNLRRNSYYENPFGDHAIAKDLRITDEKEERKGGDSGEEPEYISGFKLIVLVLALSSAVFLVSMDANIIATAIPEITDRFNALDVVGWFGSVYLLTTCSFQIFFGRIYTFFPAKWVFLGALTVFQLGSLVAGVSPNSEVFIAGRALQGVGTSGIISGALIIVSQVVPLAKRPTFGGLIGAMEGVAMVSAPLIGGALTDHATWRWCFYINLPIGGLVAAVVLFYLKVPRSKVSKMTWSQKIEKLDLLGTAVFMPSVICCLLILQWGGTKHDWDSLGIIALFFLALVLFAVFCGLQYLKQDAGTVPPKIIRQRSIAFGCFYSLCVGSGLTVMAYYLPLWFQAIKDASASASGTMILPMVLGVIIAVLASGVLVSAIGYYAPFMIAGSVIMSLGSGLMSTFEVDTDPVKRIIYPAIFGIGIGVGFQQPMIAAQTVLPSEDIPTGTSVVIFAQTFGGAIILSVAQNVFINRLGAELRNRIPDIDVSQILDSGATNLQNMVDESVVGRVLLAYNDALTQTFYIALTMACLSIIGGLGMEWKSVKAKEKQDDDEELMAH